MAYEIVLKKRFANKLIKLLAYLEKEWSHKVAASFLRKIDLRILQLSGQPLTGISSSKIEAVRSVFITRHNRFTTK